MIMDVLARGLRIYPHCAFDMLMTLFCVPGEERLLKRSYIEEWRGAMEDRGLKINRRETV